MVRRFDIFDLRFDICYFPFELANKYQIANIKSQFIAISKSLGREPRTTDCQLRDVDYRLLTSDHGLASERCEDSDSISAGFPDSTKEASIAVS